MCLYLNHNSEKLTRTYKARKSPIKVWKVIAFSNRSMYEEYVWHHGLNKSSRGDVEITKQEIKTEKVSKGFHFLLTRKASERECYSGYKIVPMTVNPQDVVAVGVYIGYRSLVATQCVWNE